MEFLPQASIYNPYQLALWWCKPLIFQTRIIWSNRIDSYQGLRHFIAKILGNRKSEFVAKTQFLCNVDYF